VSERARELEVLTRYHLPLGVAFAVGFGPTGAVKDGVLRPRWVKARA
jgi:hypothetical protein